jgi:hypothetical protein
MRSSKFRPIPIRGGAAENGRRLTIWPSSPLSREYHRAFTAHSEYVIWEALGHRTWPPYSFLRAQHGRSTDLVDPPPIRPGAAVQYRPAVMYDTTPLIEIARAFRMYADYRI